MTGVGEFDPAVLRRRLTTRELGRSEFTCVAATGSTNADLLARAALGAPSGAVLVADHQTAGRGRHGRQWSSRPGRDVLVSALLRPEVEPARQTTLVLAAGLAAHATVRRWVESDVELKWPNDVLIGGRKVAGILCQQSGAAVVVGIGLNVNSLAEDRPAELASTATSLREQLGATVARDDVLIGLLGDLERFFDLWAADVPELIRQWELRAELRGRRVEVREDTETFVAVAEGIDEHGRLCVNLAGKRRLVISGDVFVLGD